MSIKNFLMNILLGKKASSQRYIQHLRKLGAQVGERTVFFAPHQISIDDQYPWLIEIGDDVQLTAGVRILTHDYSWAVLKKVYGSILGSAGKVKIGNNVFIGSNSVILGGTDIGNNVIIGAGSIVKGIIPDNCVAVGNPCRKIMPLEEFYNKRLSMQETEAIALAKAYYSHTRELPPKELFHEFFFLFEDGNDLIQNFDNKLQLVGNYDVSKKCLIETKQKYKTFDDFINSIFCL